MTVFCYGGYDLYITILFGIMVFVTVISYKCMEKRWLSPTFISSAMVSAFSGLYILVYDVIGKDISLECLNIVILSIAGVFGGECIGEVTNIKCRSFKQVCGQKKIGDIYVYVPLSKTILVFGIMLINAYVRMRELYRITGENKLSDVLKTIRPMITGGDYSGSPNFLSSVIYHFSRGICYIYIFLFLYSLVINNKRKYSYLLPVLGFAFNLLSTTNRSSFLEVAIYFFFSYFAIVMIKEKENGVKEKINIFRLFIITGIIVTAFLVYGVVARDGGINTGLFNYVKRYIAGYSCGSLVGLDRYLQKRWIANEFLGAYTFKPIYLFFGIKKVTEFPDAFHPFFSCNDLTTNIYTSLLTSIQDFGVFGMFIEKFMLSFCAVKVQNALLNVDIMKKRFPLYLCAITSFMHCFVYYLIADLSPSLILDPNRIIKLLFGIMTGIAFIRYSFLDYEGKKYSSYY